MPKLILRYWGGFLKRLQDYLRALSPYASYCYTVARALQSTATPILKKRKLERQKLTNGVRKKLNTHGHDDVTIAVLVVGKGTQLTGGLLIFQLHTDAPIGSSGE